MKLISQAVSEKSKYRVEPGNAPTNLAAQTRMTVGGDNLTARELFAQVAAATRLRTIWLLLYDADAGCYFINMDIAMEVMAPAHPSSSQCANTSGECPTALPGTK